METVEAADQRTAEEMLKRKYGNINIQSRRAIPQQSSSGSSSSSGSQSGTSGCLIGLAAIAVAIGTATGLIKPSTQPDAYDRSNERQEQASSPASPSPPPATADVSDKQAQSTQAEAAAEQEQSSPLWGAFAVSPSTSKSAYSTGFPTEAEAQEAAIKSCAETDCQSFATFGPGYATLAESDRSWFVSSGFDSESNANDDAMKKCVEKDPDANCRITASISF